MKNLYTLIAGGIITACFSFNMVAQNDIKLDLQHMLLENDFTFFQEAETPEGVKFEVDRLEYYISEIKVTHDGGQVTQFQDLWLLVNTAESGIIDLDTASIDSVESIAFSIGVDQAHNHLDPASWPSTHPLAPKNPSMHWGWAAGYRFIAMEGMGGDQLTQGFEVHALDDMNYFETSVDISAKAENGEVIITMYADYTKALTGVDVSSGVISHGSTGEARTVIQNFRDYVFSATAPVDTSSNNDTTVAVAEIQQQLHISAAPNPSYGNQVRLLTQNLDAELLSISVFDLTGKQVSAERSNQADAIEISGLEEGLYLINVFNENTGVAKTLKVTILQ